MLILSNETKMEGDESCHFIKLLSLIYAEICVTNATFPTAVGCFKLLFILIPNILIL